MWRAGALPRHQGLIHPVGGTEKCYHAIRDGFPQLSREGLFFRSDPQVVAKGDLLGFWPVLGRGHLEKFRARVKNGKPRFPGARGTFGGKIRLPQKFLPEIAQLFLRQVLADWTPRGGKSQNTGFLGPFGLGQPLGTYRNYRPKTENAISRS